MDEYIARYARLTDELLREQSRVYLDPGAYQLHIPERCKCSKGHVTELKAENTKNGCYVGHCGFMGCNELIYWEKKK
jgi:hypothetical protein